MRFHSYLILALLSAFIIIWLEAAACSVVINEVEANPAGDEDAFKAPITAWFEFYNDDGKEVDISGWSITNGEGRSMVLPPGAVIRGLDYYVWMWRQAGWLTTARFWCC